MPVFCGGDFHNAAEIPCEKGLGTVCTHPGKFGDGYIGGFESVGGKIDLLDPDIFHRGQPHIFKKKPVECPSGHPHRSGKSIQIVLFESKRFKDGI